MSKLQANLIYNNYTTPPGQISLNVLPTALISVVALFFLALVYSNC